MFGPRPGTSDVIAIGLDRARRREIPLRLVSLIIPGESELVALGNDVPAAVAAYADRVLADIAEEMVTSGHATTEVVARLAFDGGVIVVDETRARGDGVERVHVVFGRVRPLIHSCSSTADRLAPGPAVGCQAGLRRG